MASKGSNEKTKKYILKCSAGVTNTIIKQIHVVFTILGLNFINQLYAYIPKLTFKYSNGWNPCYSLMKNTERKLFPHNNLVFLFPKVSLCNGSYPLPRHPSGSTYQLGTRD